MRIGDCGVRIGDLASPSSLLARFGFIEDFGMRIYDFGLLGDF
jgi:hypothetical protein